MRHMGTLSLCLLVVFAIGAVVSAPASARRVWEVENKVLENEREITGATKSGTVWRLKSEIEGVARTFECTTIAFKHVNPLMTAEDIENAMIYNAETFKTGRTEDVLDLSKCKSESTVCPIAEPIRFPPQRELSGASVLVERKSNEVPIYADYLPEGKNAEGPGGKPPAEKERIFANITIEGALCPFKGVDVLKSGVAVGGLSAENEGEGGITASISPESNSITKEFKFVCPQSEKTVWNGKGKSVLVNEYFDEFKNKLENKTAACLEGTAIVEVVGKLHWSVK